MRQKQETFLSDSDETDLQVHQLWCDIGIWGSSFKTPDYFGPRAKSFSTMLGSCSMHLCDHPYFLEKYPNGFYSENAAFIPLPMYERMKELEPLAVNTSSVNSYWNLAGLIFIPYLTKMIEHKYDITFSQEEKEAILLSATEKSFYQSPDIVGNDQGGFWFKQQDKEFMKVIRDIEDNLYEEGLKYCSSITKEVIKDTAKEIFNGKEPVFVSNDELALLTEKLGMRSHKAIRNWGKDDNFIDYALLKNTDMYEKGHPFNELMGKVTLPAKTIDLLSLDKDNYKEILRNLPQSQSYVLFNAFESLTYKIVNDSKNEDDLIRNVSGIWTNLALEANDKEFTTLVSILHDNCLQKFPHEENKWVLDRDIKFKLAHAINNNPYCGPHKRNLLINAITDRASDYATVRTVVYFQNTNKPTMK